MITYPGRSLALAGILLFMYHLASLRRLRSDLGTPHGVNNLNRLARTKLETFPHPDTLEYFLKGVPPSGFAAVRREMAKGLIRSRAMEDFRLFGRFYLIAVDLTGHLSFDKLHCRHCLTLKHENGDITYYHPVLEAKLVCRNGLAISIGTEFVENTDGAMKQDCELAAFYRFLPKLRADYPMLEICLLLDSLYLNQNVMHLCKEHRFHYIVTFKEGSLPESYSEFQALRRLAPEQSLLVKGPEPDAERRYSYVNGLEHAGNKFNAFACVETIGCKTTAFAYATDINVTKGNIIELTHGGGRCRWKIENEGFNVQKNHGYGLEHAYSKNETAMKNFYLLLQIAHMISQLIEKGSLLGKNARKMFGSSRAFAQRLMEAFRYCDIEEERFEMLLERKFQIRFNTS